MDLNNVQRLILEVICEWVKSNNTPIKQKEIVSLMLSANTIPQSTVKASVRALVRKGYIRKACVYSAGVSYVQLRTA